MAVHIRLRRLGKRPKGWPHFRVTVFDERKARDSRILEELGYYCPVSAQAKINIEKIEKWVKNGAVLSATVKSLLKKTKKTA
jgi:small subunit ribosomal protein S16